MWDHSPATSAGSLISLSEKGPVLKSLSAPPRPKTGKGTRGATVGDKKDHSETGKLTDSRLRSMTVAAPYPEVVYSPSTSSVTVGSSLSVAGKPDVVKEVEIDLLQLAYKEWKHYDDGELSFLDMSE